MTTKIESAHLLNQHWSLSVVMTSAEHQPCNQEENQQAKHGIWHNVRPSKVSKATNAQALHRMKVMGQPISHPFMQWWYQ